MSYTLRDHSEPTDLTREEPPARETAGRLTEALQTANPSREHAPGSGTQAGTRNGLRRGQAGSVDGAGSGASLAASTPVASPPAARSGPEEERGRRRGPGTLPLGDVERAGAQPLPVQHRLGVGLLQPKPVLRRGRREALEEAHGGAGGSAAPHGPRKPKPASPEREPGARARRAGAGPEAVAVRGKDNLLRAADHRDGTV